MLGSIYNIYIYIILYAWIYIYIYNLYLCMGLCACYVVAGRFRPATTYVVGQVCGIYVELCLARWSHRSFCYC